MESEPMAANRRILIVDDSIAIHDDFKKVLAQSDLAENDFEMAEASLFGSSDSGEKPDQKFELTSAFQGEDAIVAASQAVKAGRPFAMAFVDVRMPPGLDGIETTEQLWQADPDLQIILCTAYSDYSWKDMRARLGATDRMVILKKPFDAIEVLQLASALAEKWKLLKQSRLKVDDLEKIVSRRTQELSDTQEKLKHFLAHNPAVLYSLKINTGRPVPSWISDNFVTFTGLEIQDWYQQTVDMNYVLDEDRSRVFESLQTLLSEERVCLEYRIRHRDEKVHWVRDERRLLRDQAKQPVEIIGCWTDITGRKLLEDQLRASQKMEAFGQLAGGVAHDFNNQLTIIKGYVAILQEQDHPAGERTHGLAEIAKAADRAAHLTRQLLTFTRRQIFQPKPVDLNEVVIGTSEMMQKLVGESITVEKNLMSHAAVITADQHMLEQMIINLMANARDAMPGGGRLVMSTSLCEFKGDETIQDGKSRSGPHVCLSVADTGCGIAPENLPRIFEPFFTTKEVGKGTGLGLASVYGIVKQHQGWIETVSSLGHGTTFRFFFPALSRQTKSTDSFARVQSPQRGSETILVVEDEPDLRELFHLTLQRHGYQVFSENTGTMAIRSWASRLDQIDLLLTDIVMPGGTSGWDLARTLQSEKPELKAIYMSGYNTEVNNPETKIRLLTKPFSPEKLAETVRACLDER
jgi:signal transduction histidine kinase/DNA-binding response OmpR family regulator